jgi:hypothetical protein
MLNLLIMRTRLIPLLLFMKVKQESSTRVPAPVAGQTRLAGKTDILDVSY